MIPNNKFGVRIESTVAFVTSTKMTSNTLPSLTLYYEDKYKTIFQPDDSNFFWIQFKAQTVNDDKTTVASNNAKAILSAYLFQYLQSKDTWTRTALSPVLQILRQDWLDMRWHHLIFSHVLSEHGAPTYFMKLVNRQGIELSFEDAAKSLENIFTQVEKVTIANQQEYSLLGQDVYYYPPNDPSAKQLIPLDVLFHLRLLDNSALSKQLFESPAYARRLGLDKLPTPGEWLERPVLEFAAKSNGRILSTQEALFTSNLTPGQFEELIETSYNTALALFALFGQKKIDLCSGVLRYAISKKELFLVDSLTSNELVLFSGKQQLCGNSIASIFGDNSNTTHATSAINQILINTLYNQKLFSSNFR